MISRRVSEKIKMAGFLWTMMVLYRHSLNYLAFFNSWVGTGISGFVEDGFSLFTEIAVPCFFITSGIFFFRIEYRMTDYVSMLQKKARTLALPFVIWNMVGLVCLLLIDKEKVGRSIPDCLLQLLLSEWYGPLWYVRDLLSLMLLSPLYGWIFKRRRAWMACLVILVLFYYWIPVSSNWLATESMLFFCVGGFLAKRTEFLSYRLQPVVLFLLVLLWIGICWGRLAMPYSHKLNIIIGVTAFWNLLDYLKENTIAWLLKVSNYSFFIYVTHGYMMKGLKRAIASVFFGSDMAALIAYLLLPVLVASIACFIGKRWRIRFPKMYEICVGGRV